MEGLEFNASPGLRGGGRGRFLFITVATCNTHNTQVGGCVVIFRLLLLFPKLSVPAVSIPPPSSLLLPTPEPPRNGLLVRARAFWLPIYMSTQSGEGCVRARLQVS